MFQFFCPYCPSSDIFPPCPSARYQLWFDFGLLQCGNCGEQFDQPRCVEVSE